jgi:membrane protein DedA with SNARE-associated domain
MSHDDPHRSALEAEGEASRISRPVRRFALGVVIARFAIPLAAIPLIPVLLPERITLLVLLRPTKEWLLFGGGRARVVGDPSIWLLFAAYAPLMIFVVWAFFLAGRAYQRTLRTGTGPRWLHRAVPPHQLELAQRMLVRRGPLIAVLGRVAAMPPTILAAAAGVSDVSPRRYLAADLVGALLGFAITVGAGFALGGAYEQGGVWLTAVGVSLFAALIFLMTRWIRREADRAPAPAGPVEDPAA